MARVSRRGPPCVCYLSELNATTKWLINRTEGNGPPGWLGAEVVYQRHDGQIKVTTHGATLRANGMATPAHFDPRCEHSELRRTTAPGNGTGQMRSGTWRYPKRRFDGRGKRDAIEGLYGWEWQAVKERPSRLGAIKHPAIRFPKADPAILDEAKAAFEAVEAARRNAGKRATPDEPSEVEREGIEYAKELFAEDAATEQVAELIAEQIKTTDSTEEGAA